MRASPLLLLLPWVVVGQDTTPEDIAAGVAASLLEVALNVDRKCDAGVQNCWADTTVHAFARVAAGVGGFPATAVHPDVRLTKPPTNATTPIRVAFTLSCADVTGCPDNAAAAAEALQTALEGGAAAFDAAGFPGATDISVEVPEPPSTPEPDPPPTPPPDKGDVEGEKEEEEEEGGSGVPAWALVVTIGILVLLMLAVFSFSSHLRKRAKKGAVDEELAAAASAQGAAEMKAVPEDPLSGTRRETLKSALMGHTEPEGVGVEQQSPIHTPTRRSSRRGRFTTDPCEPSQLLGYGPIVEAGYL